MERIASDTLLLPLDERIALAHRLLDSAERKTGQELETNWDAEIRVRIARYNNGDTSAVNGPEVFEELDKKLRR
jgi:putative addiction module component (TIGR02574 family)